MRDAGHDVEDYVKCVGKPLKIARFSDLNALHPGSHNANAKRNLLLSGSDRSRFLSVFALWELQLCPQWPNLAPIRQSTWSQIKIFDLFVTPFWARIWGNTG